MGRGKSKIGGTNNFDESTVEIARIMTFGTSNRRDIVRRLMATQDSFKGLTFADAMAQYRSYEESGLVRRTDQYLVIEHQTGNAKPRTVKAAYDDIMAGNATIASLSNVAKDAKVDKAQFTANGNSVKSQNATMESGNRKIDLRFSTGYNPQQTTKPTKAIETKITATLWENGNAKGITTISKTTSKSNKNAQKQYTEMLEEWKKLTGQSKITF